MGKIESKTGRISQPDSKIYDFLSDFNNFRDLLPPDKVKNWSSTADSCQFNVEGIGNAGLRIIEKVPCSLIKITTEGNMPAAFLLWIQLKKIDETNTAIRIVMEPQMNPFLQSMLQGQFENLVNMLIDQAEKISFK